MVLVVLGQDAGQKYGSGGQELVHFPGCLADQGQDAGELLEVHNLKN